MTKNYIFLIFMSLFLIAPAAAQNDALKNDLGKSFKKVSVVRSVKGETLRGTESEQTLSIATDEKTFEMSLTPRDLRAPRYIAEDTSAEGTRRLERAPVNTYKGKINGESFSEVRLTIEGDKIEGYFLSNSGRFFIEPAKRFSKLAAENELVVYRQEDLVKSHSFNCESDLAEKVENGVDFVAAQMKGSIEMMQVIEIATEADYDYVTSYGGASIANQKVLTVLNMVEGVYESEIGLTLSVVFQHTWSTQDSFNGTNSTLLLQSFQNYWNTNYPTTQYPRDAAHLFTAKPNVMAQGFAYLGVICRNPAFAYGLSGRMYPDWNWEAGDFLVTSHEIGHNLGGNHAEVAQSCGNTLMNAQLSNTTALSFCSFSRTEMSTFVTANGNCLSQATVAAVRYDFDGDRRADIGVFRPSNGTWYLANSGNSGFSIFQFGASGDVPVASDYDGDGKTDAAVFRAGIWYRMKSSNNTVDVVSFGLSSDTPAPADFDGDGKTDIAVFRASNGTWHRLNSSNSGYVALQFGANGDQPMPADYDGDGKADVNVFRPSNGTWYRTNSSNSAFYALQFGTTGDKPIEGDFDGDGKADIAVWRPSTGAWFVIRSSNNTYLITGFGLSTDIPVAADYDGDGKTDISVFRPSDGIWHRLFTGNGVYSGFQFGVGTDAPVSRTRF